MRQAKKQNDYSGMFHAKLHHLARCRMRKGLENDATRLMLQTLIAQAEKAARLMATPQLVDCVRSLRELEAAVATPVRHGPAPVRTFKKIQSRQFTPKR